MTDLFLARARSFIESGSTAVMQPAATSQEADEHAH